MKYAILLLLAACTGDLDPQWQLSHDRIIAVRASPPHLMTPGDKSTIDVLLGFNDAPVAVRSPDAVQVVSPMALSSALTNDNGIWTVTMPADLGPARAELMLTDGAPVPLQLGVGVAQLGLAATKNVVLGDIGDNPTLQNLMVNNAAPVDPEVVPQLTDIPLSIDADASTEDINWLSSCGTMHDFDLPKAYLRVEVDDPQSGQLGVILRDGKGGVAWQFWSINAQ